MTKSPQDSNLILLVHIMCHAIDRPFASSVFIVFTWLIDLWGNHKSIGSVHIFICMLVINVSIYIKKCLSESFAQIFIGSFNIFSRIEFFVWF